MEIWKWNANAKMKTLLGNAIDEYSDTQYYTRVPVDLAVYFVNAHDGLGTNQMHATAMCGSDHAASLRAPTASSTRRGTAYDRMVCDWQRVPK